MCNRYNSSCIIYIPCVLTDIPYILFDRRAIYSLRTTIDEMDGSREPIVARHLRLRSSPFKP